MSIGSDYVRLARFGRKEQDRRKMNCVGLALIDAIISHKIAWLE